MSPGFVRNERMSRFLRFVVDRTVEGKGSELKESVIAVEVFGRRADYDPKLDSIVRTEAGRLRSRLAEYYSREGSGDPIVIELPKGGYAPAFRSNGVHEPPAEVAPVRRWPKLALMVSSVIVVLAALVWWRLGGTPEPIAIAVLPFENLGGDPSNADFVDGLTDEIISNLSVIEGLAVRSRTSSFTFKDKPHSVREAGQQLNVQFILEGSVLRSGERLRVNTQLIRVRDDFAIWSGRADRELTDVFAIQDEISRGVVNNLRLKLGRGQRRYEANQEAYELYLQALATEFPGRAQRRIEILEQVIAKDPSFAPAWASLATLYASRSTQFPVEHPADELTKLRSTAEKAIQLDPLLAEAHDALAMVYAREGRWKQAEASFRRAIELEPNRSETLDHFVFSYLRVLGRNDEALQHMRAAEKMDPLSASIQSNVAGILLLLRRYDEAAAICKKLNTGLDFTNQCIARAHLGQGRAEEAVRVLADSTNPLTRGFLGYALARAGRTEEAEKQAAASVYANEQALIFAGLGDKDRTLDALERMASVGAQRVGIFLNYPEMSLLQGDPRLNPFRRKVGLPE